MRDKRRRVATIVRRFNRLWLWPWLSLALTLLAMPAFADPVSSTPRFTFAGNLDFTATAGTLRTASNGVNACAVGNSGSAVLSGIPPGSTVTAAFLYWAGSGPTADLNVTFNGLSISADRSFSDNYSIGTISLDYFSGFADVTGRVSGNGTYTFEDLTVTNTNLGGGGTYCTSAAVVSGWGLVVVYRNPAEPLRVINLFDGFQPFRGGQILLSPSNFMIPPSNIDGKIGILTWEGDVENSAVFGGVTENLTFDGQSTGALNLTDALNPVNNQFNSTVNVTGSTVEYGVDFDIYDISSLLRDGDTSAQTTYASGGDLVFLSVQIISVTNTAAADLILDKSHTGNFSTAATNRFAISVTNRGPSADAGPITVSDTLAPGLTYQGFSSSDADWACSASGQDVSCNHPGPLAAAATLAPLELLVDADVATIPSVSNTATTGSATFDPQLTNNSGSDTAAVLTPDISTSSKLVAPLNGFPAQASDTLRYTVRVTENLGAAVDNVSIQDVLDPLLTNLVPVDLAGGTDSSTGNTLQVDNISVPAGGSVDVIFDADIVASATAGDVVNNSADIISPIGGGATVTVVAPPVGVGASPPASGIKPLYFGDIDGSTNNPQLPMALSRIPLTAVSNPTRVRIRRQDDDRIWALTPPLQSPLTIDGSDMPVVLHMRRGGNADTRDIRVSLSYRLAGASTLIGCVDAALATSGVNGLVTNETREFVFTLPRSSATCVPTGGGALTIPAGAVLELQVDNDPNGGGGRAIFVYPFNDSSPGTSRVELPANTVINVDSLEFFDAAFAGGVVSSAFNVADTVFIRAMVSDPFGSFDIRQLDYQISEPGGAIVASGVVPQVQDSGAAQATYELPFAIDPAATPGIWTVTVTAQEGSEGTVSHSQQRSFVVVNANLVLDKQVEVISDPVSAVNAKAIPDAILEYRINVSNQGANAVDADSVWVSDDLPAAVRLMFGNPIAPVVMEDGSPASGLSYTFSGLGSATDDIEFSNDGGATTITPVVDSEGMDITSPPINHIRINPKGVFAGQSGAVAPSFELRYRVRLE